MGKKYTFSRSIQNDLGEKEVFTAVEYDSFEEARTAVTKGIRDRKLEIEMAIKSSTKNIEKSKKILEDLSKADNSIILK